MNRKKAISLMALTLIALGSSPYAQAAEEKEGKPFKDATVTLGEGGKLKYTPDERGNLIPDYSRAGYMGGGVKIPDVPVRKTLEPSGDATVDDEPRIRKALEDLAAMPLDKNGFRGALLLKRGTYIIKDEIRILASGIVLRGEGPGKDGTIIIATPPDRSWKSPLGPLAAVQINHMKPAKQTPPVYGVKRKIIGSYVPFGISTITLESTEGFAIGDDVLLVRPESKEWLKDLRQKWWNVGGSFLRYERVITGINGNRVTLDSPLMNSLDERYGGGYLQKWTSESRISQVGVENLRIVGDPKIYYKVIGAVTANNAENLWIRDITAVSFTHGIGVVFGVKYSTVQDVTVLPGTVRGNYGLKNEGHYGLIQRCYVEKSRRHAASTGNRVTGPNVYLDCQNSRASGTSGPHGYYVTGALYDNFKGGRVMVLDNGSHKGSGQGLTGAQHVLWNCYVDDDLAQPANQLGRNYKMGGNKGTATPRSLYLQQLEERLGKKAVENVTNEAQRNGTILQWISERTGKLVSEVGELVNTDKDKPGPADKKKD